MRCNIRYKDYLLARVEAFSLFLARNKRRFSAHFIANQKRSVIWTDAADMPVARYARARLRVPRLMLMSSSATSACATPNSACDTRTW